MKYVSKVICTVILALTRLMLKPLSKSISGKVGSEMEDGGYCCGSIHANRQTAVSHDGHMAMHQAHKLNITRSILVNAV